MRIHSLIHWLIHSFICSFVHSFIHSLIHLLIHSFIYSFIHSFIYLFLHSFLHSFIYSFIHSFIYLFIHSFFICCSSIFNGFFNWHWVFFIIVSWVIISECLGGHLCHLVVYVSHEPRCSQSYPFSLKFWISMVLLIKTEFSLYLIVMILYWIALLIHHDCSVDGFSLCISTTLRQGRTGWLAAWREKLHESMETFAFLSISAHWFTFSTVFGPVWLNFSPALSCNFDALYA